MRKWICGLLLAAGAHAVEPFPLSDSDPDSPEFRRRFMASYGVNEAIEPQLTSRDRPIYEQVAPLLASRPREAIRIIRDSLGPDSNPAFHFILGNLHYQVQDYPESLRSLERSLLSFPSFRRAWRTLALCHVQMGDTDKSIPAWLKVIELGGGDAQSYGLLGYAYSLAGKYESGLSAYRMARMFKPDSADFRRGQALCLLQTHQPDAAIALLEELIAEQPDDPEFWLLQANGHLDKGDTTQVIVNLEVVSGMGKATWSSMMLLGDLYLNERVVHRALTIYEKALAEQRPRDWNALLKPLDNLLGQRYYLEAGSYLARVEAGPNPESTPESEARLRLGRARIRMELGDAEEAVATLLALVETDPLNGEALMMLGDYYHAGDDPERALIHFGHAAMVPEFQYRALISQGRVSVSKGDLEGAAGFFRQAEAIESRPYVRNYLDAIEKRLRSAF